LPGDYVTNHQGHHHAITGSYVEMKIYFKYFPEKNLFIVRATLETISGFGSLFSASKAFKESYSHDTNGSSYSLQSKQTLVLPL
jgi:hypothetical protein